MGNVSSLHDSRDYEKSDFAHKDSDAAPAPPSVTRRRFLEQTAAAGIGAAALSLMGSRAARAADTPKKKATTPSSRRSAVSAIEQELSALDPDKASSILDGSGRLRQGVTPQIFAAWKKELNRARVLETLNPRKAAVLHLLVGEYELAGNEEPVKAGWHFRRAKQLVGMRDHLYGWAAYNEATGLFYEGGYEDSCRAFHDLLQHKPVLVGFDRRRAARWQRHTSACAGEHAKLGDLDIRYPQRLDPLCGVSGLCVSLKTLGLPGWDKKTVMANTHITGRGTSAQDLVDACAKLGGGKAVGRVLTADEEGLIALPKPLIAHVCRDHFVTVTDADKNGVTYLCTDCGAWPGGKNKLTWKQWRALKPGVYVSVVKRGTEADRVLAALIDHPEQTKRDAAITTSGIPGIQVAMNPLRKGQSLGGLTGLLPLTSTFRSLYEHVAPLMAGAGGSRQIVCGFGPGTDPCADGMTCCPTDGAGPGGSSGGGGGGGVYSGSSFGDPVNLATLEEQYTPPADLTVYNPNGPAVVWSRLYNSLRGYSNHYVWDDFGTGWSQSYNIAIYDPLVYQPTPPDGELVYNGVNGSAPITGSNAPTTSGVVWEIADPSNTIIATSSSPNGWDVVLTADPDKYNFTGTPPFLGIWLPSSGATLGGPYTVRYYNASTFYDATIGVYINAGNYSGTFTVIDPLNWLPVVNSTKYVVFPNGAHISFTMPNQPSSGTPTVACNVQAGAPFLVNACYEASTQSVYFQVIFADQTTWQTVSGAQGVLLSSGFGLGTMYSPVSAISDRVGNTINLNYSGTAGPQTGLPVLSTIVDATSSTTLLTINRDATSGAITSVADCYGRSIYYSSSYHSTANVPLGLSQGHYLVDQVSQIVTTGTSSPAMRYQYAYSLVNNGEGSEQVPMLTGITVPSPTGTGTGTTTIAYDSTTAYVASITDANGNVSVYTSCDGSGTPITDGSPSNYTLVTKQDSLGNTVYSYMASFDGNMSCTGRTDGAGTVIEAKTFSDPNNPVRPDSVADGNGRTTYFTWDQYGNVQTSTSPRGTVTVNTWDYTSFPMGRLTSTQEGTKGAQSFTYYEPSGLIETITKPGPYGCGSSSVTTTLTYNSQGSLVTIVSPGNNAATTLTVTLNYTTDGSYSQSAMLGQPVTITDALGHVTHLRYDSRGNAISKLDAEGNLQESTYDLANRIVNIVLPATGQTGTGSGYSHNVYQYVGGPLTLSRLYDESGALVRQISYTYGAEGELAGVTGSTEPASYEYDAAYRRSAFYDGNSHMTQYSYNTAGYLSEITYPGSDTIQFPSYNDSGQLLQRIDGNSVTTNYGYDSAGFLSSIQYPATTSRNASFTYDDYDRISTKSDGEGTYSYSYDDLNNLTAVTTTYTGLSAKSISYTYYPDGNRAGMTLPGSAAFTYEYDAAGRPTSLTNPFSETTNWDYYDNNWLLRQTNAAISTKSEYGYNALGQMANMYNWHVSGNEISKHLDMTYDGAGNRTYVLHDIFGVPAFNGTVSYTYDSKDQLTQEASTRYSSFTNGFGYDSAGNPTSFAGSSRSYNSDNQRTGTGFAYDGNGNPTTYGGSTCTFDPESNPTAFGTALTAGYTIEGIRAWKQNASSVRTYFLYDGTTPVLEMNASGSVTATNTFGVAGLISRNVSSVGSTFYMFDERGNVVERLDASGLPLSVDIYSASGACIMGGGDPFGFGAQSGYYTDTETGLILCTYRYYDVGAGRWLTRDPLGYAGGKNLYGYCGNNPLTRSDAQGLSFGGSFIKGLVGGIVTGLVIVGIGAILVGLGASAAFITGAMFVIGVIGAVSTVWSLLNDPSADNFGYALGGLVGGAIVGGATGGRIACRLSPPKNQPVPGLKGWSLMNDWSMIWRSKDGEGGKNALLLLTKKEWPKAMSTGPSPLSGAGAIAGGSTIGGDLTQWFW